jgi:DNA polymerase III epsilon subunit family exonuclease
MRYVIADIEATGLGPEREMIELALIVLEDGHVKEIYETLLNPLVTVAPGILQFTGISAKSLTEAPKFYEVADKVATLLNGAIFVSHNVEFDWHMLTKAFALMDRPIQNKTLCTFKLSHELIPGLKSYTLEELCRFFNIKTREHHRALPDARATLALFQELQQLVSQPRAQLVARYLPQHQSFLKSLPRVAGVLYCKDSAGVAFQIEATDDLWARGQALFEVAPEKRAFLERCEKIEFEVTGSELIAQFKRSRFTPVKWTWMITVETDKLGEKFFHLKPFVKGQGIWTFEDERSAQSFLRTLKQRMPVERFAWREGGKTKEEILEHNRHVEAIAAEAAFPCENLLLWGPGRTASEWSYVLVRGGQLIGWGHDERSPEEVLKDPESAIHRKTDKTLEALTVRYLREHREKRHKKEQWRELKELSC